MLLENLSNSASKQLLHHQLLLQVHLTTTLIKCFSFICHFYIPPPHSPVQAGFGKIEESRLYN